MPLILPLLALYLLLSYAILLMAARTLYFPVPILAWKVSETIAEDWAICS